MVRSCVVRNCPQSDQTILSHRFPRPDHQVRAWQHILRVNHISIPDLHAKYVVCTLHFKKADYRNPASRFLNSTALPTAPPYSDDEIFEEEEQIDEKDIVDVDEISENDENEQQEISENVLMEEFQGSEVDIQMMLDSGVIEVGSMLDGFGKRKNRKRRVVDDFSNSVDELGDELASGSKRLKTVSDKEDTVIAFDDLLKNYRSASTELSNNGDFMTVEEEHLDDEEFQESKYIPTVQQSASELEPDEDEGEFTGVPRCELIQQIRDQSQKIKELEEKLKKIENAQVEMTKSMEVFKNLFIPGGNS